MIRTAPKVARYKPRGFFKLHTDHLEAFNDLCCGGRLGTLILYLNDDFRGGHTEFPRLGVSVEPVAGDAIYFHNVKVRVPSMPRSLHALPLAGALNYQTVFLKERGTLGVVPAMGCCAVEGGKCYPVG